MADDSDSDADKGKKDINVQIPGEDDVRYISAKIPIAQYKALDRLKDEYGMTWRGLLVHAQRELNGYPAQNGSVDEECELHSQYKLINKTRKRNGLTWKGMLLSAARDLRQHEPVGNEL